ncbi:MAG: dihydropteroate synthase [Candidatus Poribacteria bacterium]|nr:dihydropteroate synthase [Candidatus Poribacteria bacterium]
MKCRGKQLVFGQRTLIMGVLNVTPDSFSESGRYFEVDSAIAHAKSMVKDGADIIDIGGESSRPGALSISANEELARILPVVEALASEIPVPISIDTCKAHVARLTLQAGAHIVNDISALNGDSDMASVISEMHAGLVLMHMKGNPRTMQHAPAYQNVTSEICLFFQDRIEEAEKNGIHPDCILIDPGIGFGKTTEHNLEILRRLRDFQPLNKPILIGTSNKSFIGKILDLPVNDRMEGTAATVAWAIAQGADVVRVHNVKAMRRVAQMTDAIYRRANSISS